MEFRLVYDGRLPSNGSKQSKHAIREQFHDQLKRLWSQIPLSHYSDWKCPSADPAKISLVESVDGIEFVPLVCSKLQLYAEVDVLLLRPGPPGAIVSEAGDVDNQLKTLFDALRYPHRKDEFPKSDWKPTAEQVPFFCVLEDDKLITRVSVTVDRLLTHDDPKQVHLVVMIQVRATMATWSNISIT